MSANDPDELDALIRETRRADTLDTFRQLGRIAGPIILFGGAWLTFLYINRLPGHLHPLRQIFWRAIGELFKYLNIGSHTL